MTQLAYEHTLIVAVHHGERAITTLGVIVAVGALLGLVIVCSPVATPDEFLAWWGALSFATSPAGVPLDRLLRPLFWHSCT